MAVGMRGVIEGKNLRQEAQAVAAAVVEYVPAERVVVVCGDDELRGILRGALRLRGIGATRPDGMPLIETAAGSLVQRVLAVIQQLGDDLAAGFAPDLPVALAALGAHPLVADELAWAALETLVWRGVRFESWAELREKAARAEEDTPGHGLVEAVAQLAEIFRLGAVSAAGVMKMLDGLAPTWRKALGGAALLEWLLTVAAGRGVEGLAELQAELLRQRVAYPAGHDVQVPLLRPHEALGVTADLMIVTGLNVGWDAAVEQPVLADYGIEEETPDVLMQLQSNARAMVVSRTLRRGGEATVAAPAWQELMQRDDAAAALEIGRQWLPATPVPMGQERALGVWPALGTGGPQTWSASWLKTVMDCPYQAVGRRLLALEKLAPFGTLPDKATGGILVHEWVEEFWQRVADQALTREAARALFLEIAERGLAQESVLVQRLWQPRLARLARALVRAWQQDTLDGRRAQWLEYKLEGMVGEDAFSARADRVDVAGDGSQIVVDYKTGHTPTPAEVKSGRQPQLPLEAALLVQGGARVSGLEYWQLRGYGREPVKRTTFGDAQTAELAAAAAENLPRVRAALGREKVSPATPEPRGACKRCPLSGVCRWREVAA